MPLHEFAPDTGHESDSRAVSGHGLYLPVIRQPSYYQQVCDLEARALQVGGTPRRAIVADALRLRRLLTSFGAPVPPVVNELAEPGPDEAAQDEELAHLRLAALPSEDAVLHGRDVYEDYGAYYGETDEEAYHRD